MMGAKAASRCETRIITPEEVTDWARGALPGDVLVYCTGPFVPAGPTRERVAALLSAKVVRVHLRRTGATLERYLVKLPDAPPSLERAGAPKADEPAEAIFAALERAATRNERAPSDAELARLAGLDARGQAQWRVRLLARAGRIAIETVSGPDRCKWRVITILSTGQRTANPPEPKP